MADALAQALKDRGLHLGFSPHKGRCLFASRDFSRGELLLEQFPYASVLNEDMQKRCDGCFKEGSKFKRCAICRMVHYCSSNCQKQEWPIHKYECKSLVTLFEEKGKTLTSSLRLMLRFLIKRHLQLKEVNKKTVQVDDLDNYRLVDTLPTHFEKVPEQQLVLYAQMANLVKSAYTEEDADIKEITQNFCRLACNAHTILDEELRPLGIGLYPVLSIINHSCIPNCILIFEGKRASLRALEPMEKGSEVMINYVEIGSITEIRQKSLREQYFFDCDCARCQRQVSPDGIMEDARMEGFMCSKCKGLLVLDPGDDETMLCQTCRAKHDKNMIQKEMEHCSSLHQQATRIFSSGNFLEARHALEQLDRRQTQVLKKDSLHRIKTFDLLIKVCMSLEDWSSALLYCRQSIPSYKRAYKHHHPLLGLQLYTCGKLEWYLEDITNAVKSYRKALGILELTHGGNAELVSNLRLSLQEAEAAAHLLAMQI